MWEDGRLSSERSPRKATWRARGPALNSTKSAREPLSERGPLGRTTDSSSSSAKLSSRGETNGELHHGSGRGRVRFGQAAFRWAAATAILAMAVVAPAFGSSQTLAQVKTRGRWSAGSARDCLGSHSSTSVGSGPFDVDFCRALAAAVFGDASKVKLVPLSADAPFQALRDGKIDVLSRNSTWTMGRETEFGLTFVGVTYYDGQGFMVPRALHVNSALELDGAKVCVQSGTTTIDNLADFFASNKMTLEASCLPRPTRQSRITTPVFARSSPAISPSSTRCASASRSRGTMSSSQT